MKVHGRLDKDIKKRRYHPILWGPDRRWILDEDFFIEKNEKVTYFFIF
ncbi:MAG: hypothetical protein LBC33_01305 [Mycoplasmataceae bacterium]|nr:hypothetical protein [Mycoplasmataceae bacterium]